MNDSLRVDHPRLLIFFESSAEKVGRDVCFLSAVAGYVAERYIRVWKKHCSMAARRENRGSGKEKGRARSSYGASKPKKGNYAPQYAQA